MHVPQGGRIEFWTSLDFRRIKQSRLATFLNSQFQYIDTKLVLTIQKQNHSFHYRIIKTLVFECVSIWVPTVLYFYVQLNLCKPTSWNSQFTLKKMYSKHLITKHLYHMHLKTGQYGCPVFKWLSHVTWWTIWILNILGRKSAFSVQFSDHHLNTRPCDNGHKSTIQIPD